MAQTQNYIHLQNIGRFQAKKVKDIVIGRDYFVWNWGYTSKPVHIIKETPKFLTFLLVTKDGRRWERRLKKDRLVAYTTKEDY